MFRKLASLGYPDQLYGMLLFAFHSDDKTSSRQMRCALRLVCPVDLASKKPSWSVQMPGVKAVIICAENVR